VVEWSRSEPLQRTPLDTATGEGLPGLSTGAGCSSSVGRALPEVPPEGQREAPGTSVWDCGRIALVACARVEQRVLCNSVCQPRGRQGTVRAEPQEQWGMLTGAVGPQSVVCIRHTTRAKRLGGADGAAKGLQTPNP
jgi:hypothetical protein